MDPALQRLIEDGGGDDEVAALVRVAGPSVALPSEARVVARFGEVLTVRVPRGRLEAMRAGDGILSVKAPRRYRREDVLASSIEPEVLPEDVRRPEAPAANGAGAAVGIVDWGLDFTHPAFRDPDGRTRLLALWDQQPGADPAAPNRFGYGRIHAREAIDAALGAVDPFAALGYDPTLADTGGGTHGTATASIAAGSAWPGGVEGVAPAADIMFVHFSTWGPSGPQNLGDSVALAEALAFMQGTAAGRPCAVNLSMGRCAGPHDGSTSLELLLDNAVASSAPLLIGQSGGNYFGRRTHAELDVEPRGSARLPIDVHEDGLEVREIDVWYAGADRLLVGLVAPDGSARTVAQPGGDVELRMGGRPVARLQSRLDDPNNERNQVVVRIHPAAPAGRWQLVVLGAAVTDGHVHVWIEREAGPAARQTSFPPGVAVRTTTTGTICNGRRTLSVGAYDAHDPARPLTGFSSSGDTVDGRAKPDLVAPGDHVLTARSRPPGLTPDAPAPLGTRMSGTSMAAPFVTGALACLLEATGGTLPPARLTEALLASCEPHEGRDAVRAGAGYLDLAAALERLTPRQPVLLGGNHDDD